MLIALRLNKWVVSMTPWVTKSKFQKSYLKYAGKPTWKPTKHTIHSSYLLTGNQTHARYTKMYKFSSQRGLLYENKKATMIFCTRL